VFSSESIASTGEREAKGPPIHVIATTIEGTRPAIRAALTQAEASDSRVYVFARHELPRSLDFVSADTRLHAFVDEIRSLPEATSDRLDVLPCASAQAADLMLLLPPDGIVFVGGRSGRWWLTAEQRLARRFASLGCRVLFVHAEESAG
jgi:hypothetical protein